MSNNSALGELRAREKQQLETSRRQQRSDVINSSRRGLGYTSNLKYSVETVTKIATKLKSKGSISVDELLILMYALSEHEDHISSFFKIHGAVQGLIKELTGIDARKQLIATGCICNLALGPTKSCLYLAKNCGTYLITYLQSQNRHLMELCTWSLGNLSVSDSKIAKLLEAQGLLDNIIPLLDDSYESKTVDGAAYALSHLVYSNCGLLTDHQMEEITQRAILCHRNSDQLLWLIYLLSDKSASQQVFTSKNFFKFIVTELIETVRKLSPSDMCVINCLIRIAANLCDYEAYEDEESCNVVYTDGFVSAVKILLSSGNVDVIRDTLWLLGNIYNTFPSSLERQILFSEISITLNDSVICAYID
ncbi:transmembrane and coiled-coil domain-containing protein 6 [Arctopsyche grandis]|uniref:transmembrane and coiled-coil domain-containing protein 6 n=1 Tax=Arctopsyche grandis TaxID=121162 RepID=UPI00406D84B3